MARREFLFTLILLSVLGGVSSVFSFTLLESVIGAVLILGTAWYFTQARSEEHVFLTTVILLIVLRLVLGITLWAWLGVAILLYILLLLPSRGKRVPRITPPREEKRVKTPSAPRKEAPQKRKRRGTQRKAKDDLTLIKGIGPKVAKALHQAGIRTFKDLASAPVSKIEAAARKAGLRAIPVADWQKQAQLAAEGKWNELRSMQKKK